MEYRRFGKTDEQISVLTLGGMRFKQGWTPPRDRLPKAAIDNCLESTRRAFEIGINHIETAYGYVKSEHLFGTVLKELDTPRGRFKMMTKGAPKTGDETRAQVESQLQALQLDYVDFYGWHGINNEELLQTAVRPGGPVETLHRLREEGLIRHIGFSTHGPLEIIEKAIRTDLFSFVNLHYYYFFQRNRPAVELAGAKDLGILIISPNDKGGNLWNPSEQLKQLCHPLSAIQFNGRFCLSHPQITTLTLGMHAPEHFDQNLAMLNGGEYFSNEDVPVLQRMDDAGRSISSRCTYCSDCLPCPENINIPEILRFRNLVAGYDMEAFGKYRYNMLESKGHWFPGNFASHCTECGDCLPKCPEKLDIPRLLLETHRSLFSWKSYLRSALESLLIKTYKGIKNLFLR
ncbi:MAG: aldo/keto reductase [Nitrospinaceae bacterium]|nr:aldo/keto reductase [Nitrospinaceae bacterium]NIR53978.1 aldo/keto reductase [Nitrospinaceae bacterium]NIS84392.1 aldo/keto reductase [Nitrospinaceae bacterium]NIT83912.1 aldo/keto reductase [Nitrospinaceae bacterium]NIU43477.1 aldo/keto reductase [Nitrospinaceae bacterium]